MDNNSKIIMALLKTFGRIAQLSSQNVRLCAYMAKRGYAAEASEMSFTFATPAESFYSDAKVKQVCFFYQPSPINLHHQLINDIGWMDSMEIII